MTNEDWIRCMPTNELVELLLRYNGCPPGDFAYCQKWDCDDVECWKKWLKQEVKDEEAGF